GKVATIRADGSPHVTPVWFATDDGDIVFNTWHTSAKAKHMRRDARVGLVVDLQEPPYAYVSVQGRAELSDDLDEVRRVATRIGGRYMGEDRADEFGERNGVEGELVVRIIVDRIIAKDDVAG
ncbi:MAG: PPOX class F420-dependent oxidoreductase, partial [Acidimicrobiia bacterium]